jgi:hypothetical protein
MTHRSRQSKHDRDREEVEKNRTRFRDWPTDKLREHLKNYEGGLYKHVRLAIKRLLAERENP